MLFRKGLENAIILYVLLFLACMNCMGQATLFFLLFDIYGFCNIKLKESSSSKSIVLYLMITLSAFVTSCFQYELTEIIKPLVIFCTFYVAYYGYQVVVDKEKFIRYLVFAVFAGFFANLLLTYYLNFYVIGHVAGTRILYNYWTHDVVAVTLTGLISSVVIGYSFYCLFCHPSRIMKILGVCCILLTAKVNIDTATRTPFVMLFVVYAVLLYELYRQGNFKQKVGLICLLGLIIVVSVQYLLPNLSDSAIANRFNESGLETSRWQIMEFYFSSLLDYPFGGHNVSAILHKDAHNLLFEGFDYYGIIFFVLMLILQVVMIYRLWLLHRIKNKTRIEFLLMAMMIAVYLQSWAEPVLAGYPQLAWSMFLFDGLIAAYLRDKENCNVVPNRANSIR